MPQAMPYLDCCKEPVLETVKPFDKSVHDIASIRRCRNCGCHWYYRLNENPVSLGAYDRCTWCVKLSPEESDHFIKSGALPPPAFFANRPGILKDEDGASRVVGLPDWFQ